MGVLEDCFEDAGGHGSEGLRITGVSYSLSYRCLGNLELITREILVPYFTFRLLYPDNITD